MNKHSKKMIAPIIISILVVLYYAFIAVILFTVPGMNVAAKLLLVVISLALTGVMIGVLVSRIKEIRSGEEDDLSNY